MQPSQSFPMPSSCGQPMPGAAGVPLWPSMCIVPLWFHCLICRGGLTRYFVFVKNRLSTKCVLLNALRAAAVVQLGRSLCTKMYNNVMFNRGMVKKQCCFCFAFLNIQYLSRVHVDTTQKISLSLSLSLSLSAKREHECWMTDDPRPNPVPLDLALHKK